MSQQHKSVKAIFDEAAEFPSQEQRTAYLDKVCAGNLEVRQKVEGQVPETLRNHLITEPELER